MVALHEMGSRRVQNVLLVIVLCLGFSLVIPAAAAATPTETQTQVVVQEGLGSDGKIAKALAVLLADSMSARSGQSDPTCVEVWAHWTVKICFIANVSVPWGITGSWAGAYICIDGYCGTQVVVGSPRP